MVDGDETFPKAVAIITVGMVVPALAVAVARDLLVTSISYGAFLSVLAVGFGVAVVVLLEWSSLDRITFAFAAIVWPWVVFFTAVFAVLLLNEGEQIPRGPIADIFRTLYGDSSIWDTELSEFSYGAIYMIAGVGGVAVSRFLQRRTPQSADPSE